MSTRLPSSTCRSEFETGRCVLTCPHHGCKGARVGCSCPARHSGLADVFLKAAFSKLCRGQACRVLAQEYNGLGDEETVVAVVEYAAATREQDDPNKTVPEMPHLAVSLRMMA
jgi:hypothetical protein